MAALAVADRVVGVLNRLEPGESLEAKLKRLLSSEIRRRLGEYERIDRQFRQKYQVSLQQFEDQKMLEKQSYSFAAESDYHDWDLAVDGIQTLHHDLQEIGAGGHVVTT